MEYFNFDAASNGADAYFVDASGETPDTGRGIATHGPDEQEACVDEIDGSVGASGHRPSVSIDIPMSGPKHPFAQYDQAPLPSIENDEQDAVPSEPYKKNRARLPKHAVRVLRSWLAEHADDPYPSREDNLYLMEKTGLSKTQIRNWLANSRKRKPSLRSPASSLQSRDTSSARSSFDSPSWTPLERWQNSPPEDEPASLSDVYQALVDRPSDYEMGANPAASFPSEGYAHRKSSSISSFSDLSMTRAASARSSDSNYSSASDLSLSGLFTDHLSITPHQARPRSRSRHRHLKRRSFKKKPVEDKEKAKKQRLFRCTFCTQTFPTKYDWQRHEKSIHLNLDQWVCAPHGATTVVNGVTICIFCSTADPDLDHIESHDYSLCQGKRPQDRMFNRKDHLAQHLKLTHSTELQPHMDDWSISTQEVRSRCGFCDAVFSTWKERNDHLATHFKAGCDMFQWHGDWGFEPHVQDLVKNAMPPYLIGEESVTLEPWRPTFLPEDSQLAFGHNSWANNHPEAFQLLYDHLVDYIIRQKMTGAFPSDHMIQNEARRLVYGSEDDWDQTSADNLVWLNILKSDARICAVGNIPADAGFGLNPP
ncbi:hypothetical protein P170DRAFT_475026 [Aspergillus steynii IBT 23096]|uniref:Homeobox and C2H2 transcription factor n=1 Tax=Aspergillus steynii IBT 23096 TaxID=1392250 RepID=A0A2I2G725_9EURO|nr:uncharacterized protein P170DRAFT_475026 [Aspergillus steynii IBT 23096]PLB48673.1 hypothetical protein P170DRAFT_475026 [Aspergillus steynii IBT 23096]